MQVLHEAYDTCLAASNTWRVTREKPLYFFFMVSFTSFWLPDTFAIEADNIKMA